jgi:predicted nucleic acid-binding protein
VRDGQTAGAPVMDAVLTAIALEHGARLCTTDRDFSRFSELRWTNPLAADR